MVKTLRFAPARSLIYCVMSVQCFTSLHPSTSSASLYPTTPPLAHWRLLDVIPRDINHLLCSVSSASMPLLRTGYARQKKTTSDTAQAERKRWRKNCPPSGYVQVIKYQLHRRATQENLRESLECFSPKTLILAVNGKIYDKTFLISALVRVF